MTDRWGRSRSPYRGRVPTAPPWRKQEGRPPNHLSQQAKMCRSFDEICSLPAVRDMLRQRLNDEHRPEQTQYQERTHRRLSSLSPRVWLEAIWFLNNEDLWDEAILALQSYEWHPPQAPENIREGWSPHRELHWQWLRAPGILRPSQALHQRHMFMFMGRPYTVNCVFKLQDEPNSFLADSYGDLKTTHFSRLCVNQEKKLKHLFG